MRTGQVARPINCSIRPGHKGVRAAPVEGNKTPTWSRLLKSLKSIQYIQHIQHVQKKPPGGPIGVHVVHVIHVFMSTLAFRDLLR